MTDVNIWGINGKINRTIASSNMTVSITDYDGSNFSALNPLVVKIGDTPRLVTGALSITLNAGNNWFNLGSAELKALRHDLFVYLGWRASSSSVFLLLSRIPYGELFSDFSVSQTNEKYGAWSGTTPASTDKVINIGRVNAQNSGSAAYNWSLPPVDIIINRPIFESEWSAYTSVLGGFSGTPSIVCYYLVKGKELISVLELSGTSNATTFTATLAFSNGMSISLYFGGFRAVDNNSVIVTNQPACAISGSSPTMSFYKDWGAAAWTASGTKAAQVTLVTKLP